MVKQQAFIRPADPCHTSLGTDPSRLLTHEHAHPKSLPRMPLEVMFYATYFNTECQKHFISFKGQKLALFSFGHHWHMPAVPHHRPCQYNTTVRQTDSSSPSCDSCRSGKVKANVCFLQDTVHEPSQANLFNLLLMLSHRAVCYTHWHKWFQGVASATPEKSLATPVATLFSGN